MKHSFNGESPACLRCGGEPGVDIELVSDCPRAVDTRAPNRLTVADMQREAYETACEKGWHDDDDGVLSGAVIGIAEQADNLINVAERVEYLRRGRKGAVPNTWAVHTRVHEAINALPPARVRALSWLVLIPTEVAEAIEDVLAGRMTTTIRENGKPEGLGSELADIIIRVCDTAGALSVDLEAELRAKLAYNRTRPHRHGGKLA